MYEAGGQTLFDRWRGPVTFFLGPLAFLALIIWPPVSDTSAARQIALITFTLLWWVGEPVPLGVTSLLIPALAVLLGLAGAKEAFKNFAHPLIFLFMGSFIIAEAIVHHGLDRWMAGKILNLPWVRRSPVTLVFAFGAITWFLSMWISNTAATAMMIPLSYSILRQYAETPETLPFATGGVLFIAYAASVGGIATPIGTPPNLVTLGFLEELANISIPFFQWMKILFPASLLLLMGVFLVMYLRYFRKHTVSGEHTHIIQKEEPATKLTQGQKGVLIAFSATVIMWIGPGLAALFLGKTHPLSMWLHTHIPEATAAVLGTSLLFLIPSRLRPFQPVITWKEASRIDWNTILLFGGGLTLGELTIKTGVGHMLGEAAFQIIRSGGLVVLVVASHLAGVTLTEFMSNTATSNLVIPVIIAVAKEAAAPIMLPVLAACVATSLAFLLPVSTPPNAIAYGSGYVPIKEMIKSGFFCDVLGLIVMVGYLFLLHAGGVL